MTFGVRKVHEDITVPGPFLRTRTSEAYLLFEKRVWDLFFFFFFARFNNRRRRVRHSRFGNETKK